MPESDSGGNSMKKISAAVLAVVWMLLFLLPVSAAELVSQQDLPVSQIAIDYDFENQDLEEVLARFRAEKGLHEDNFSMSCYITGTEELHSFAGDTFRVAASTYKLPLNMVYYDREREGRISSESYIDGYYLPTMHYETIVNSNNDMAISMLYNLGSFRQYREIMTQFCDQAYPSEYYADNNINSDYMLSVLWKLYTEAENYPELLENMKIAARGQYFQLYQTDYDIAHKYGYFEGAINDVGIIYTPEPVLAAAYTENVSGGESILGSLAELLTEYSLYHTEKKAAEERARLAAEEQARLEAEAQARLEAEEQARLEAEEQARLEEERIAAQKAAEEAQLAAEQAAAAQEAALSTPEEPEQREEASALSTDPLFLVMIGCAGMAVVLLIVLTVMLRRLFKKH